MKRILIVLCTTIPQRTNAFLPPTPNKYTTKFRQTTNLNLTNEKKNSDKDKATSTLQEANDALTNVGWSLTPAPIEGDAMTSDDPFVQSIDEGIQNDFGVGLNDLLNPAKVVNLERDLYNLRIELASLTNKEDGIPKDTFRITTDMVDDVNMNSDEIEVVRKGIAKKERDLLVERRAVFQTWLKNVFLGQAVLSLGVSWIMVTNPNTLFGGFSWYYDLDLEMPIRVLGFWWWWLFIVPSLRSRRPSGPEKKALDIAFLGTPLISILAPSATKDPSLIWIANFLVVVAAYGYAFTFDSDDNEDNGDGQQPAWLKFVYKSLDFGSGRERGARK